MSDDYLVNSKPLRVGLALSGGGSRAIAFHLGCLRALHANNILPQVRVVSAVSGGAIIGALYAYRQGSFGDFEAEVEELLRKGLLGSIIRRTFSPAHLMRAISTSLTAGLAAKVAQAAQLMLSGIHTLLPRKSRAQAPRWKARLQPPLPRWYSRASAFEAALESRLFGKQSITAPRRHGIEVVLNATELQTGTAFRFGSRSSMAWRYGHIEGNDISIAEAVAASAAYPAFLPAFHRTYRFKHRDGVADRQVLLTDGGVFDNLGVTCLEPGREKTDHVYNCDAIICCSAGMGQWTGGERPYGWMARMNRAVLTTFRKNEDGTKRRLFGYLGGRHPKLQAVILSMLGQKDERLHKDLGIDVVPDDLVPREAVMHYPTDFNAMPPRDINRITRRGEQLTKLLVDQYWPS